MLCELSDELQERVWYDSWPRVGPSKHQLSLQLYDIDCQEKKVMKICLSPGSLKLSNGIMFHFHVLGMKSS